MRTVLNNIACLAALAVALLAVVKMMANAPAFNTELRTESVLGDWRVPVRSSVYNKADYQFQIGFGYLRGDAAALLFGEEDLPSFEDMSRNLERATQNLELSLTRAPGNATAWTSLAWARAIEGDIAAALPPLMVSWRLAPLSAKEAIERLSLVETLEFDDPQIFNEMSRRRAFMQDLKTVRRFEGRYFELFITDFPRFSGMVD